VPEKQIGALAHEQIVHAAKKIGLKSKA